MKRPVSTLAVISLFALASLGCNPSAASGNKDPATACTDLCTASGFASGRAEEFPHELNCFCEGGNGSVAANACTQTCTDLGWSKGEAFSASACQCSGP
jgi:hypothetical protein